MLRRWISAAALGILLAAHMTRASGGEAPDALSEAVAAWLKPRVKLLSRELDVYHYAMRTRIGLPGHGPPPGDFDPTPYLQMKVPRYWDLSLEVHPFSTASGLYVASDPVIARAFGGSGDVWAMIELVLKPGFRFVDVRGAEGAAADEARLPAALRSPLAAAGCDVQFAQTLLVAQEVRECRALAVKVLRSLQVDGILYEFPSKNFEPCRERPPGGFIVVSPDGYVASRTRVFVTESESSERLRIQDLFARAHEAGSRLTPPWPGLPSAPQAQMVPWIRQNIFGCGNYPEDRVYHGEKADSAAALYGAAAALAKSDRIGDAVEAYRAVLNIDPDFVPALDELSWIRATNSDPAIRNPAEAEKLAGHLVELTHYQFRRSTGGLYAKLFKIHASHTLAAAFAANGKMSRAVDYAIQSIETARQLIITDPSPAAEQLLRDG